MRAEEDGINSSRPESSVAVLIDVEFDGARYLLVRMPKLAHSSAPPPLPFPHPQRHMSNGAPNERRHKFGRSRRVLVAENDSTTRLHLMHLLHEWGFEVTVTTDGEEALKIFEQEQPPVLAIMNRAMPGIDGTELCRRISGRLGEHSPYILMLGQEADRQEAIDSLESGAAEFLITPFDERELRARLIVAGRRLDLQDRLISSRDEFRDQAAKDALTGVFNRRRILEILDKELELAERSDRSTGILMIDLDNFKNVNDTLGHPVGDLVLQETASRLRAMLRSYDCLGRYGGEEFLIVVPATNEWELRELAERIRCTVESEPVHTALSDIRITVSIGATMATSDDRIRANVIAAAGKALYKAKKLGRNRIAFSA